MTQIATYRSLRRKTVMWHSAHNHGKSSQLDNGTFVGESGRLFAETNYVEWASCQRKGGLNNPRKLLRASASALAFALVFSGVAVIVPDDTSAETLTTLRIGMVEAIDSLNPFIGIYDNSYVFYGLVYDYLIAIDEDLNPKPNLAVSWNIVPDVSPYGSVWQYNLTRNAKWHDGEPFDADDVVFTVKYQIGGNWDFMWAYQPYTVLISDVERVDDYTVRVHFADMDGVPVACSFGHSLMMPMVPEHYWREISAPDAGFSHVNPKPLGTGPFMCTDNTYKEFLRGDRLILFRNPDYHGAVEYGKEVHFDRLILQFYLEPAAMVADMQRGAIDVAAFDAPNFKNLVDWVNRNPATGITTHASLKCTAYSIEIGVNTKSTPGTNPLRLDPAVRQAIAHATDKEFNKQYIYMGYAEIGSAILSPIYPYWYWEPGPGEEYEYSIARANEILDEAGYVWNTEHTLRMSSPGNEWDPLGRTTLTFDMIVEEQLFEDKATAKFLVNEWAKIGIKLEPMYVASGQWGTIVYGYAYDTMITYWSGDPDPNYLLYTQTTAAIGGWSENAYSSEEYDENYTGSLLTVDPELRKPYVINCQKHIYYDAAFIVTVFPYGCYAWREDRFTGWGDWTAHPGRELSNFWSANDLFFDLIPVEEITEPSICMLDNLGGPMGEELEITGFAWNPTGSDMSFTLEFGDGDTATGTVASGTDVSVTHAYSVNGTYSMNLTVVHGPEVLTSSSLALIVPEGENSPPTNLRVMPSPLVGAPGQETVFTITGRDRDGDMVSLTLDFEDGTIPYNVNVSGTADGFEEQVARTYDAEGVYSVSLLASDAHWDVTVSLSFVILEPESGGGVSSMALAALAVILVAAVAVAVMLVRRRRGGGREEEDVRLP